jgi:hypothetical protein
VTGAEDEPQTILQRLRADIEQWCAGGLWQVRVPLLLFMAWIGYKQLTDAHYSSLFAAINLGIHEAGHLLFSSLGEFLHIAGGTILQLMAPTASMIMFLKQRDYFGIAVCFAWLSTNFYEIARYQADAEVLLLDLVTVGDSPW